MNDNRPQGSAVDPSVRYGVEIEIPDTGEKLYLGELVKRRTSGPYELSLCYDERTGTWWIVTKADAGKATCAGWSWEKRTSAWNTFLHTTPEQVETVLLKYPPGHRHN